MSVLERTPATTSAAPEIRGTAVAVRRRIRWLPTVVVVLAVLLVAEVALRAAEDRLPPPSGWISDEYPMKRDQVAALADEGGAGVVLLGSSVVDTAVDPAGLSLAATGERGAYNAGLIGSTPAIAETWGLQLVVPALRPDVVVVAVSSRDLNGNGAGMRVQDQRFAASLGGSWLRGTQSVADQVEWWLNEHSALVRDREALRYPLESLFGYDPPDRNATELTGLGFEPQLSRLAYRADAKVLDFFRQQPLHDFAVTDDQLDAVRRTLAALEADGIRTILLDVPVTEQYVALHPRGEADFAAYEAAVEAVAAETGAELVRPGLWPEDLFSDPLHVNGAGVERLTAELDRYLTD